MFKLVNSETLPLTPVLVTDFMKLEASPTERALDKQRLAYLQKAAEEERLINFLWAQAVYGNQHIRLNGQHSGTMLQGLNGKFPEGLTVHMDTYSVDDDRDLVLLFRQFDSKHSSRSSKDVAGAYLRLEEALKDVELNAAKLAIEGAAWFRKEVEGLPVGAGDDRYQLFHQSSLHEFIRWAAMLLTSKTPELRPMPVVAAMYGTLQVNRMEAITFWQQVARGGADYEEDAPSTVLDKWLREHHERKPKLIKPGELHQGCVFAWNAYRRGRSLDNVRYDTGKGWFKISE